MKVKVVYSLWAADGFDAPLGGGVHDLDGVTEQQARSIAAAAAAGVVEVLDASKAELALADGHVQSQEDSEAAYAAAQEAGTWQHGNLLDFVATRKTRLLEDDKAKTEPVAELAKRARRGEDDIGRAGLTEEKRAEIERQIAEAEERLAGMEVPS